MKLDDRVSNGVGIGGLIINKLMIKKKKAKQSKTKEKEKRRET